MAVGLGLTDLDELVLTCRTERARDYIQEALQSYRAGAYLDVETLRRAEQKTLNLLLRQAHTSGSRDSGSSPVAKLFWRK